MKTIDCTKFNVIEDISEDGYLDTSDNIRDLLIWLYEKKKKYISPTSKLEVFVSDVIYTKDEDGEDQPERRSKKKIITLRYLRSLFKKNYGKQFDFVKENEKETEREQRDVFTDRRSAQGVPYR